MSSTIFRAGTANLYDTAMRNLAARQTSLADQQERLTAGKRVLRASDDPVSAAQAERSLTRIGRIQTEQRALQAQRNAMAQAESTLGEAVNLAQHARELLVQAGNGSYSASDRKTAALQLQSLREQLLDVANRKDSNGVPLLSALGSSLQPFAGPLSGAPDYAFLGLPGQAAASGSAVPLALDGDAAFMFHPQRDAVYTVGVATSSTARVLTSDAVRAIDLTQVTGDSYAISFSAVGPGAMPGTSTATYTVTNTTTGVASAPVVVPDYPADKPVSITIAGMPGLALTVSGTPGNGDSLTVQPSASLFSTLDRAIESLSGNGGNANATAQALSQALANMDSGMQRLHNLRGYAGEMLNRADRIDNDNDQRSVQLKADQSRAEDIDMIQGISDFQNQQIGYEAALKSYAQVQRLSLFNYLG